MNNITTYFGAPGCGKTKTLMDVLVKELKVHEPNEIAFVSFTKKGSYEGRDRAIKQFDYSESDFPYFRTIHSLAFRDAGLSKLDVVIPNDDYKLLDWLCVELTYSKKDIKSFINLCSVKVNNFDKYKQLLLHYPPKAVRDVAYNYDRYKHKFKWVDFDDMVLNFIKKGEPLPVKIAIIDEAQDLTTLQWQFCEVAFRDCERVYIGGDDDQAIFEWGGADVNYFLGLNSNRIILDKSYRLRKNVLDFSKQISCQIKTRVDKQFAPIDYGGNVFFYNNIEKLKFNRDESYYLLARTNYPLEKYKKMLEQKHLVYKYKQNEPNEFSNSDGFKVSARPDLLRAINSFKRLQNKLPISDKAKNLIDKYTKENIELSKDWYDNFIVNLSKDKIAYYNSLAKNNVNVPNNKDDILITISTIHGVKGGEADNVVLILDTTKRTREALVSRYDRDAEMRCLYVACTRAKKSLHIVYSNDTFGYNGIIDYCKEQLK